ncbi:MAG: TonB-dependent receptor, partial [Bacteroidales bacterium]|nr:TonB-dependent receptor [Bacteroidales bacterium]
YFNMKFILFISIFLSFLTIYSQERPQGKMNPEDMPKDGVLKGQVIDADLGTPVQYANVVVKRVKDGTIAYGTVADDQGKFVIEKMMYGKYNVEFNFIGFAKTTKSEIMINPNSIEVDLGKVSIKQAALKIDEVEVVAERKYVEYKIDKKVINVGQDLNSVGETAVEILENTPSVTTDIDGNVSLRGSGNFTVLIDGIPSVLEGSEALQQIPASIIESIEIITNPSAKYDPDGVAGIINVITKKKKEPGYNGLINATVDSKGGYSGDILLNFRVNKLNVFVGGDYANRLGPGSGHMDRITQDDTIAYYVQDVDNSRDRLSRNVKVGFDYIFNDYNSISINGSYGLWGMRRTAFAKTNEYYSLNGIEFNDTNYITDNLFAINRYSYNVNSFYLKRFKVKGEQISFQYNYSNGDGADEEELTQYGSDNLWNYNQIGVFSQKTGEESNTTTHRFQADYVKPFGEKGKFEAGLQGRLRTSTSDYFVDVYDYENSSWVRDNARANNLEFDRSIYSGYSTYTNAFKKIEYMFGLRGEYTNREISSGDDVFLIDRFDYFPTLHASRKLGEKLQLQASYSKRINRPREWYLDPYKNYMNPKTIRVGNPALEPEYTDSYEINLQRRIKSGSVSVETYFRQTNNLIQRVQMLLEDNVMEMTFENLENDQALGLEFMGNADLSKWWNLNLSFNLFNYKINGELLDQEVNQATNTWSSRMNNTFKLKTGTKIQFMLFYSGPSVTAQGESEGFLGSNIAIRQDFLKNNLSVTFRVQDIFGSMNHAFTSYGITSDGNNYTAYNKFLRESPVFSINLSYKINNFKQKREQGSGDDIRIDDGGDM